MPCPGWVESSVAAFQKSWRVEMKDMFKRLWREESGQDLTEYALLLVLISLAAIASMRGLAGAISTAFLNAQTNLAGS
jgi:pilus assembly protein Flp/PilA